MMFARTGRILLSEGLAKAYTRGRCATTTVSNAALELFAERRNRRDRHPSLEHFALVSAERSASEAGPLEFEQRHRLALGDVPKHFVRLEQARELDPGKASVNPDDRA